MRVVPEHTTANMLSTLEDMINNGANLNSLNVNGETPLHKGKFDHHVFDSIATEVGNTEAIKFLLQCGANPNIKNKRGETPADIAKQQGIVCPRGHGIDIKDFLR